MTKKWYVREDENRLPDKVDPDKIIEGQWEKCPTCGKMIHKDELQKNLYVCPTCEHYFILNAHKRIDILLDLNSFKEIDHDITSADPLGFKEAKTTYKEKLKTSMQKTKINEAVLTGQGQINGQDVLIGIMDFSFFGGSMGSVVGEKVTRVVEKAIKMKKPVILVSSSGGARMQEGIFSLMQMAKTSAALGLLSKNKIPFISILTHPTTGGVTASFAMLGDVIMAEPKALIGFAGPRVIEQTIKQKLPKGFQKSEFLLEHGLIDMVVERKDLKVTVSKLLDLLSQ